MAATAAVNPSDWRVFVERVLSVWSGYQLAVDFNSAGSETLERHKWFVDVLAEFVYTTRGLKVDDLEQWMTSLLYNDFDLILEDDSVYPTSVLLLEAFSYMKNNNQERLAQLIAGLPSQEAVQQAKRASQRDVEEEGMEMDDVDEEMDGEDDGEDGPDEDGDAAPRRERQPRTVTDDDGWTTILRR